MGVENVKDGLRPKARGRLGRSVALTEGQRTIDVTKELTTQQFNALIPWVFNIGAKPAKGFPASAALAAINACQWVSVPGDFTHYDHVTINGVLKTSCGLYARDRVSGHYWHQGTWAPRSTFTSSCPAGSVP